jgi:integrase
MARTRDYLFQRPGSQNWYIKLQSPENRIERSLHTSNRREAEIFAAPLILEHKKRLLERPRGLRIEESWRHQYEPGREHAGPDGQRILATDRQLFFIGHDGTIVRTEANGGPTLGLVGPGPLTVRNLAEAFLNSDSELLGGPSGYRPKVAVKNADDAILETYLRHKGVTGYYEREARTVWTLFKSLCNKPLKDATRDDGRKLVQHFEDQNLKSATIQKKIGWLTAAVNLAINEGRLKFNPFSAIVPKRDDKEKRLPLDEADIRNAKRNLDQLDKSDQLLFRLLATTGMRLSEAFDIDGEMKERGCRYIIVGHKTPQSHRRVPLPAAMLPYLPAIKGSLFQGGPRTASKRLNRFLRDIGIADPRKVIHSLRHRAQDRLRAAGCPVDLRWAILGHEEKTVAEGYGEGFPVPLLKRWIDKIGF